MKLGERIMFSKLWKSTPYHCLRFKERNTIYLQVFDNTVIIYTAKKARISIRANKKC